MATAAYRGQHFRKKRRTGILSGLVLLVILFCSFFVRAGMANLPAFTASQKDFMRNEQGVPYLTEMDSYFYLRKAAEMAEQGKLQLMTDRMYEPLMGSQTGAEKESYLLPLGLSALAYLIWKYLLSFLGLSLVETAFWMGPVLGSLAAIPAFWYGKKRSSLVGGIAAGLLVGCAIPFVVHTHAGFFDTDMLLASLPLTAILCLMESMRETRFARQLKYALISAAAFSGIALSWNVYYAYVLMAFGGVLLTLAASLLLPIPWQRRGLMARGGLLALGLTMILILFICGKESIRQIAEAFQTYTQIMAGEDQVPYPYTFTLEMQPLRMFPEGSLLRWFVGDLNSIVGRLGGVLPLALAVVSVPFALVHAYHRKKQSSSFGCSSSDRISMLTELCCLFPWAAAGIYLTLTGNRFAEIAVLPVGMLAGLALGRLFSRAQRLPGKRKMLTSSACMLLLAGTLAPTLYGSWKAPQGNQSMATDSLNGAMTYLRESTSEDAAIAAWWDGGYFLEYQARRRTLADGGTDSGKLDWFLARALLTPDTGLSRGILRMLNHSGTAALDALMAEGLSVSEASNLLFQLLPAPQENAAQILQAQGLPLSLLEMTHPANPAPLTLVLTTDLPEKYPALTYYGFWNPEIQAQGEGGYIMPPIRSCELEEGYGEIPVRGAYHLTILLREDEHGEIQATYTHENTEIEPSRVEVWEEGQLISRMERESERPAIILVKEGNRYSGLICTQNLADSLLIRALFCEDAGLDGLQHLGTWYGDTSTDPANAHRRVDSTNVASWAVQVWQVEP